MTLLFLCSFSQPQLSTLHIIRDFLSQEKRVGVNGEKNSYSVNSKRETNNPSQKSFWFLSSSMKAIEFVDGKCICDQIARSPAERMGLRRKNTIECIS